MPRTLAEKILLDHADDVFTPGDIVMVRCDLVNDVSGLVAFRQVAEAAAKTHDYDQSRPSPSRRT